MQRVSLLLLLVVQILLASAASNDVVTENLKLYVDGSEYFIKAMCYSPTPLGHKVQQSSGNVGGGFCSAKVTPFGNTVSTCYDSDFFDGGGNADGKPEPIEGGWFQPVWDRDFPHMKTLGVNTLRMYSANPTTRQASIYYPEIVQLSLGKDHVPFMDKAQEYGFKVIFPLIGDYGMMTQYTTVQFRRLLRWQIDEIGNHPALLMWSFGNELPLFGNPELLNLLNSYIAYIRQYTFSKWGRRLPITCAVVDYPESYDYLVANMDVDVFTSNAGYRGKTLTDLWSGNAVTQGFAKLSCRHNKPLFIGEINYHSLNNAYTYENPTWFNSVWRDIVSHMDQGCIGGAFFEYNDEPLKEDALQQSMGVVSFKLNITSAGSGNTEFVFNTDIATPKAIIYDALRAGSVDGKFYNYNSNPFYLFGRAQTKLGASASICSAYNFKQCPGANTCSYNGLCDGQTGSCTCHKGWTGSDCSQPTCSNGCSGRGTCLSIVSPPVCKCNAGWTGADCSVQMTTSNCATYCAAGNGVCSSAGVCVCYNAWSGSDCTIPNTSYPPANSSVVTQAPTKAPTTAPTQAATTQAPTTTTRAPSTQAPSTQTPSTQAPTTTTRAPSTQAPSTQTPSTQAPTTTRAPSTQAPSTQAPTTTRAPSTQAPSTQAPTTTRVPSTQVPSTQAPTTTRAPSTQAPSTQAPTQASSCFVQCGADYQCCGYACYSPSQYGCVANQLCQIGTPGCFSGSATQTPAPSTSAPTTTTTVKAVPSTTAAPSVTASPSTTVRASTAAPSTAPTTAPTTVKPTAAATTTTTTQANSACGANMQSCGLSCYDPQLYTCFDGHLCGNPAQRCGEICYNPSLYTCVAANQIVPV